VLAPSGEQLVLVAGEWTTVITEVGATLRALRFGSRPIVLEFAETEVASGGRGQVLAPWPNRLEDGSYRFGQVLGRVPLDEPELQNAIHGLVRRVPWSIDDRSEARTLLSWTIPPQPAYPFRVRLELVYELDEDGLKVTCLVMNTGSEVAPFGLGFHPYLLAGPGGVDRAGVELVAEQRLLLDDRNLPVGETPVAGSAFELNGTSLGSLELNECYTGLAVAADGRWHASVESSDGRSELWADAGFGYAMCYTGDWLEEPTDRRKAIAIEPMTCPPNALRTGTALIELPPGGHWQASWGIAASLG
jgi:aldose 1-epimerase